MYDLYETNYGIFNHLNSTLNKNRPLASVAMFECEDINNNSLLEQVTRTYVKKGIKDVFGLNLNEFLNLPKDIIEILISISDEERRNKENIMSSVEKEIGRFS